MSAAAGASKLSAWDGYRSQNEELRRITRELLYAFNHKLSQPLTSLRCCLELITLAPQGKQEMLDQVTLALGEADRTFTVLRGFLELLDPVRPGEVERVDLAALLALCVADLQVLARQRDISASVARSGKLWITAPQDLVKSALWRLLTGVAEECPEGGNIRCQASPASTGIEVLMEDSLPVQPNELQTMFDPFLRFRGAAHFHLPVAAEMLRVAGASISAERSGSGTRNLRICFKSAKP